MNQEVNSEMIQLARESRGFTQKELKKRTSISQGNISKFERGELQTSDEQLGKIAKALDYPKPFFYQKAQIHGFGVSGIYHRKRLGLSTVTLKKIQADFNIRALEVEKLLQGAEIQTQNRFSRFDIDDFDGDATQIARLVRAQWRLPLGPVKSMIVVIESAGGIVFKYDLGSRKLDAQSQWIAPLPPLFFLNSKIPADRLRFTLAHEIGHVILHQIPTKNIETEANEFASEFLMPRDEILPDLMPFSLDRAMRLKPKWKVSIAALIMRACDLGVITDSKKRRYFTQLSAAGYRTREPITIPDENPSMLRRLIAVYEREHAFTAEDVCRMLLINESDFRSCYLSTRHLRIVRF